MPRIHWEEGERGTSTVATAVAPIAAAPGVPVPVDEAAVITPGPGGRTGPVSGEGEGIGASNAKKPVAEVFQR